MDTATRKAKALRYYLMGLNATEIGKLLDLSPRTVQAYMQSGRWREKRTPAAIKQRAYEMHLNGWKYREIADALQVSKSTIYNYIREMREQAAKERFSGDELEAMKAIAKRKP